MGHGFKGEFNAGLHHHMMWASFARMPEHINVNVKNAVKVVISRWDDLSPEQIAEMAEQVWYADPTAEGQADMLRSLGFCKHIDRAKSLDDLVVLWRHIEDSHHTGGKGFGGLIYGEGTPNYRPTRKFIEGLFVPKLLEALDREFNVLALRAESYADVTVSRRGV